MRIGCRSICGQCWGCVVSDCTTGNLTSTGGTLGIDESLVGWRHLWSHTDRTVTWDMSGTPPYGRRFEKEITATLPVPAGVTLRALPLLTVRETTAILGEGHLGPDENSWNGAAGVDVSAARGGSPDSDHVVRLFDHQLDRSGFSGVSVVSKCPRVMVPLWIMDSGTVTEAAHRFTGPGEVSFGLYADTDNLRFRIDVWGIPVLGGA